MKKHDSVEELGRLLRVRLEEWRLREKAPQERRKPVVTITREPGSEGESIAERLSAELGMHLYNWELVEQIAKDEEVSTQLVSTLEKHPRSELEEYLDELLGDCKLPSQAYLGSLKRVLLTIAIPGNAVIVGRGSNFFLPPDKKIGLCFVAPLDLRIKNTMKELGISEKGARKHISKLEGEHRKLVKKYFETDIRESAHYHLVVNTALVKPETIVQIVKTMIMAQK
jgi:cytidylate kinase